MNKLIVVGLLVVSSGAFSYGNYDQDILSKLEEQTQIMRDDSYLKEEAQMEESFDRDIKRYENEARQYYK